MSKVEIHRRYMNKEGIQVPGVTTILSLLAKPALIHWAWEQGCQGLDYRKVRDKASDIGTLAHYLIECEIKGEEPDISEYSEKDIDKAENAFLAWLEWKDSKGKIETVASEIPLVSERYQYGGTLDWVLKQNGNVILVDFKTSNRVYDEMTYQLAAYQHLWNENNPDKKIKECYILRIGKENGEFEQRRFKNLDREFQIFLHLLEVYKLQRELKNDKN